MNIEHWRGPMEKSVPAPPTGAFPVDTDEAELVRAAQADPSTFAQLYRRYLPRMYNYVRARLDGEEDAADLTQQIFLQRSEEHTSELQSRFDLVCRLLLEKK